MTTASSSSTLPSKVAVIVRGVRPAPSATVFGLTDSEIEVLAVSSSAIVISVEAEPPELLGMDAERPVTICFIVVDGRKGQRRGSLGRASLNGNAT